MVLNQETRSTLRVLEITRQKGKTTESRVLRKSVGRTNTLMKSSGEWKGVQCTVQTTKMKTEKSSMMLQGVCTSKRRVVKKTMLKMTQMKRIFSHETK